jgi:putative DNA primase/helicase
MTIWLFEERTMAISSDLISNARDADILEIARRAGATLKRVTASEWVGPCPACGGTDRFSVNTRRGDGVFNCRGFGGGNVIGMVQHALGVDFLGAIEFIAGRTSEVSAKLGQKPEQSARDGIATDKGDALARTKAANAIWSEAIAPQGTIVESYLRSRRLDLPDEIAGAVIRFHAACPWRDGDQIVRVPAMICAIRAISGDELIAIHRTRLTISGEKVDRRMLGPSAGAAIKLDADDTVTYGLAIGEGVETCLAARQLQIRPVWALGSAGAIERFPVLNGIDALTLLAEDDETSQRATEACGERWHNARREVIIVNSTSGKDLNDAIRGAA